MSRMRAMDAVVHVLRKEGVDTVFGAPGAESPMIAISSSAWKNWQPPRSSLRFYNVTEFEEVPDLPPDAVSTERVLAEPQ